MPSLEICAHPLLDAIAFETVFPRQLGEQVTPEPILGLLKLGALAPISADDRVRSSVRDLLRHGGYKPTGRGKPASEYLLRAASEETLSSINAAVNACNAVSLHSGLPISVVDLAKVVGKLSIAIAAPDLKYVFNASGQEIDVDGLLCLFDEDGPCANAVKDSQRTKTGPATTRTLTVIWGSDDLPGRSEETYAWYVSLLTALGAKCERWHKAGE